MPTAEEILPLVNDRGEVVAKPRVPSAMPAREHCIPSFICIS